MTPLDHKAELEIDLARNRRETALDLAGELPAAPDELRFGRIAISPSRRALRRGCETVKIGSRAFDLLTLLAERAGEVVGKDELVKRAWPNMTIDKAALRVHITAIRNALGGDQCITIEAVPGEGYRLVAPNLVAATSRADPRSLALAPMIGRDDLVAVLVDRVRWDPLTTLVGPGGVGKTIVASAVAHAAMEAFRDGAYTVDLGEVSGSDGLSEALGVSLGVNIPLARAPSDIITHLRHAQALLVLETCEHLANPVARFVERLIANAPGVRVMATSREPLNIARERVHRLAPLDVPPPGLHRSLDVARSYPATALYLNRSEAAGVHVQADHLEAVVGLCRKLDGLPLAIEFAAAQAAHASRPESPAHARFLTWSSPGPGRPARHRTIRSMIDWGFQLLTADERMILILLASFPKSFTMAECMRLLAPHFDTGRAVCIIGDLASKSFIEGPFAEDCRYRLLHSTRQYAKQTAGSYNIRSQQRSEVEPDPPKNGTGIDSNAIVAAAAD